nr:MAG TPA: hypothetical protein [Caudoviricetes sp.]
MPLEYVLWQRNRKLHRHSNDDRQIFSTTKWLTFRRECG